MESLVPQLHGGAYPAALDKINANLRLYFDASSALADTSVFIGEMMKEYGVENRKDLGELLAESPQENREQSFQIEYMDDQFLSVSISGYLHPQGGRPMFSFESACYSLSTGEKLALKDFFSLDENVFLQLLISKGYLEEEIEEGINRTSVDTSDFSKPFSEIYTNELFATGTFEYNCAHFYFNLIEGDLHLRLVSECNGPAWPTAFVYGINVKDLSPHIVYPSFKNRFALWGEDIYGLIGSESVKLDSIVFNAYTVRNGGGYMLPYDNRFPERRFGISYWNSDESHFRVFSQWKDSSGVISLNSITDIWEFRKKNIRPGETIVEQTCFSESYDPELFAVVRSRENDQENYSKIKKAWRANRETGKFEKFRARKIKKCSNESYGL